MNKILLNQKGRNHIRVMPLKECLVIPEDGAESIKMCQTIFTNLQHSDDVVRHSYHKQAKKGYLTGVYELQDKIYLTNCIRTADKGIYVLNIYVFPGNLLGDALAIEKFLIENIETMMADYKNQILEAAEDGLKHHDA